MDKKNKTVNMAIPKLIYRFNIILPIKIPAGFLVETDKVSLKFMWKFTGSRITETILRKKNKVDPGTRIITSSDKIESLEINPHIMVN